MVTLPTIHMNGTSREELTKQAREAYEAAMVLERALVAMAPHGRDYYPQGDGVINQAIKEYRARLDHLNKIMSDLGDFAEHLVCSE